jgi:hypothetical protein
VSSARFGTDLPVLLAPRPDRAASTGQHILDLLTAVPDTRLVELVDSAHESTLDCDLERLGLEWLSFVRQHMRILIAA